MNSSVQTANSNQTTEKVKRNPIDFPFLIAVLVLLAVGLMMLYSAGFAVSLRKTGDSYTYIRKQVITSFIGLAAMFLISVFPDPKKKLNGFFRAIAPHSNQVPSEMKFKDLLRGAAPLGYFLFTVLLVIVLFTHHDEEKRWLYFPMQFQPSDFMKIFLVLSSAFVMTRKSDENNRLTFKLTSGFKNIPYGLKRWIDNVVYPLAIVAVPVLLVVLEPHLSGSALLFLVGVFTLFAGGLHIGYVALSFVGVVVMGIVYAMNNSYMLKRLTSFLDPFADITGSGHQAYQSLISIGSGGLFGLGYGESHQKYLFLPESHNDFIFSIVAEELGFVGVVMIILLFAFLVWRGIYISMHLEDRFSSLVVFGITAKIASQVILNLVVVSCIGPTTGIALPFFSYGGTAMVVLLTEMGIVLRLSREMDRK